MNRAAAAAGATDAGLAHFPQGAVLIEGALERTQLAVSRGGVCHLGLHQIGAVALAPMLFEHEPSDVPELELTQLAQVAGAGADAGALAQGPVRRFHGGRV